MRREWAAAALAVSVGAILRGVAFANGHSLWLDEVMLSLNVAERSFEELARPLAFSQVAPIPFLWLLKLATLLGGVNELSLRIIPLLAGIVLLWLQWRVTRQLLGPRAAIAATTLAAVSPVLLRYSYEVKQYELDAAVTLSVVALVLSVLDAPDRPKRWWWLGVGGAAAMLISQPAVFVVAGAMSALLLHRATREVPGWSRRVCAVGVLWLATFAALVLLVYRSSANPALYATWSEMFLVPGSPGFANRVVQVLKTGLLLALPRVISDWPAWLIGGTCVGGLVVLWRRRGAVGIAIVLVPFGAALAAALVGKYPAGARTLVFTAPLWILAYAGALAWASSRVPRQALLHLWAGCLAGFGVLGVLGENSDTWAIPVKHDARTVVRWVTENRGDDPVYVLNEGLPSWAFYTTDWDRPDLEYLSQIRGAAFKSPPKGVDVLRPASEAQPGDNVSGGRLDLLGRRTTARWREGRGWVGGHAIDSWAQEEAARIRAAPGSQVWVVALHSRAEELQALLDSVGELGGSVVRAYQLAGAEAYHLRFATPPPTLP